MHITKNGSLALFTAAFVAALVASACGGAQQTAYTPAPTPSASGSTAEAVAPPAPAASGAPAVSGTGSEKPWDSRSHEEQLATMKKVVMPTLGASFKAHDATKYAQINCGTCHGAGAKQGNFQMPNPALPKLNAKGGFKKHMDATPAITKFMMEKVVPETAAAIGEKPYDPATHSGFGCGNCHMMEN